MVDETRVRYKAIVDFTALSRSINTAKKNLRELREEEAKLNAQSIKGAGQAAAANDRRAQSMQNLADASRAQSRSIREATAEFISNSRAARDATQQNQNLATSHRGAATAATTQARATQQATAATSSLAGVTRNAYRTITQHTQATNNATNAQANFGRGARRNQRELTGLAGGIDYINKKFKQLGNWRPSFIPPFIALVPIIAGLLGMINPLVAGLGAVGAAAIGFAASLGSIAPAALAVIPALATLLSVVGALKVAFGGIGGAFKAFSAMKKATATGGNAKAELTQQEEITRAQEKYARAIQDVAWAQEDLDDERKDYIKRLQELQRAVDKAAQSELRAAANAQLARENYANVLADPGSTKGEKMSAKAGVGEAQDEFKNVIRENKDNAAELQEMKRKGMAGDREVIRAQRQLTDAIWAQRDAQLALVNAQNGTNKSLSAQETAANAFNDALNKLSPSARRFVEILIGMNDAWTAVKRNVQEAFFSQFVDDVGRLRLLFGPLESLLTNAAGALGRFVDNFILLITSPEWGSDIVLFGERNVPIIENVGSGLLDMLDAFKDIAIVAQEVLLMPFAERFKEWAERFREWVDLGRESGTLQTYLEGVRTRLDQWWRIVKNIGLTLYNFGKAAMPFADWITGGLEKTTEGWLAASEEALGPNSKFKKYLEDIKPLVSEIKKLFATFFGWFAEEAADTENIDQMVGILQEIRTNLGPALGTLLDTLAKAEVGPAFIDAVTGIVEIITKLAQSPATETFFTILNALLDFLKWCVSNPVIGAIIGTIATGFAAIAAVSLVFKFSGISAFINLLLKLAKGGKGLPALLKGIGGALLGALGIKAGTSAVAAGTAAGTGAVVAGGAGGKGKGKTPGLGGGLKSAAAVGGAAALSGSGFVGAFTGNMELLEIQFGKTSVAKDLFIRNLQLLEREFGIAGGTAAVSGGTAVTGATAGPSRKDARKAAGKAGRAPRVGKGGLATVALTAAMFIPDLIAGITGKNKTPAAAGTRRGPGGGSAPGATKGVGFLSALGKTVSAGTAKTAGKGFNLIGSIGRGLGKGGIGLGTIAAVAGTVAGDLIASGAAEGKAGAGQRVAGNVIGGVAGGAATGALIGSIIPGLGTGVGAGIGAVVGGATSYLGSSDEDKAAMNEEIGHFFEDIGKWFADVSTMFWQWLTVDMPAWFAGVWNGFMTWLTVDIPGWLTEVWTGFMTWLTVDIPAWVQGLADDFYYWLSVEAPLAIGAAAHIFYNWLTVDMPAWFQGVYTSFMNWLTIDMPAWFQGVWDGFMTWLTVDMPAWLATVWNGFMTWLTVDMPAWLAKVWNGFMKWLTIDLPRWVGQVATAFWRWLTVDVPRWVGQVATTFWRWLTVDLPGWIAQAADDFWNWLTVDVPKAITDAVEGIGKGFTDWVSSFFKSDGGFFSDMGKAWDKFIQKIKDNLGLGWLTVPNGQGDVPGGIVGPTAARVLATMPQGMHISSGYRDPAENARAGGVSNSLHQDRQNPAVDIVGSAAQMASYATMLGAIGGWRQLYYNGVHAPGVGFWPGHWDHIHVANKGGRVPGTGSSDTVPALVTPGEYILRKKIVELIGTKKLDRVNAGMMFNGGGLVPGLDAGGGRGRPPVSGNGSYTVGTMNVNGGITFGDIHIHNPEPETASESLPRTVRKLVYVGKRG